LQTTILDFEDTDVLYVSLGLATVGGAVLVVLTKLSILMCGAIFGVIAAQGVWQLVEPSLSEPLGDNLTYVHLGVLGSFGLLGACLSYKLVNTMLKSVTAFIGAFFIVSGGAHFYTEASDEPVWLSPDTFWENPEDIAGTCEVFCVCCYVMWVIIFILGAWYQHRGKNLLKKDKPLPEEMHGLKMVPMHSPPMVNLQPQMPPRNLMMNAQKRPQHVVINGQRQPVNLTIKLKKRKGRKASREICFDNDHAL